MEEGGVGPTIEHGVQRCLVDTSIEAIIRQGKGANILFLPLHPRMLGPHGFDDYLGEIDGCLLFIAQVQEVGWEGLLQGFHHSVRCHATCMSWPRLTLFPLPR